MNHREQLIALLGLKADAPDSAIQSSLDQHGLKVTSTANALSTVTAEKAQLENKLTTANGQITDITKERDTLKTANGALTTERDDLKTQNGALTTEVGDLRKGLLDIAEGKGAITPAERAGFETRLTTANTRGDAIKELPARKAMNVKEIEIGKDRIDLSTANARAAVLETAIAERMEKDKCDRNTAYSRVKADTKYKPLFDAMADPTRKES